MSSGFFDGFGHAFHGLTRLFNEESHFRFQAIVAIFLTLALMFLPLTYEEAGFILVSIILVLASEALNTIIERIMDFLSKERMQRIGGIKDMTASVVLINSIGAAVMGIMTVLHYAMRVCAVSSLRDLDVAMSLGINSLAGKTFLGDDIIIFFGSTLAFILGATFIGVLGFSRRHTGKKIYYVACAGIAAIAARFGVTELIRFLHPRMRPFIAYHAHQLIAEQGNSFPSGHAAFFFALSTVVFSFNKKLGTLFFGASVLMSIARVAAGVHYMSDIVMGMIVGIGTALIVIRVMAQYKNRIERQFKIPFL